jgi:hypothetical protein
MNTLRATICGGKELYGVWLLDCGATIAADGVTVEEAKASLEEAINFYLEGNCDIPEVFKTPYTIEYVFDISGLLKYYSSFISFAGMKTLTGINQKQLWSYANGYRKPKPDTSQKIIDGLKAFGNELSIAEVSL